MILVRVRLRLRDIGRVSVRVRAGFGHRIRVRVHFRCPLDRASGCGEAPASLEAEKASDDASILPLLSIVPSSPLDVLQNLKLPPLQCTPGSDP